MKRGPKHKLCRRLGSCVWGNPKCPSARRPYSPGMHGNSRRRRKVSTYGGLLLEKQKLRAHYNVSEKQLRFIYQSAKSGGGATGDKLLRHLELRLASVVYRSGLAPSIFAAQQAVGHRHIRVDGKVVSSGGRVLCATALGGSVREAQARAYALAERITWREVYYRRDIGHRAVARELG